MNILLKKRLLGAAILLLLLALILPQFLTGSGDALSLRKQGFIPDPPQDLLESQLRLAEQIQVERQSTAVDDGTGLISRQLPVPRLDEVPPVSEEAAAQGSSVTEAVVPAEVDDTSDELTTVNTDSTDIKAPTSAQDIDLIGQLERAKRTRWAVQVGAFRDPDNAQSMIDRLKKNNAGYPVFSQKRNVDGVDLHVVFIGPILSESAAVQRRDILSRTFHLKALVKPYEELGLQ